MSYSAFAILGIVVHFIINSEIFLKKTDEKFPFQREYRKLLWIEIAFFLSDAFWGFANYLHISLGIYISAVFVLYIMGLSVVVWVNLAAAYVSQKSPVVRFIKILSSIIYFIQITALIINFFSPILFHIDEDGNYILGPLRNTFILLYACVFLLAVIHTLYKSHQTSECQRRRYLSIAFSGVCMIFATVAKVLFPHGPFLAIGFMLASCVIHSFVVENKNAEYLMELKEALGREAIQEQELDITRNLAFKDSLTGLKNKLAYIDAENRINYLIGQSKMNSFAIAVFDLNNLKKINDSLGHEKGDDYIQKSAALIAEIFHHSPVFRIGGDEFVAILENQDFTNREKLAGDFNDVVNENLSNDEYVVSIGLSEYNPVKDMRFEEVFFRADKAMYKRKQELKQKALKLASNNKK